MNTLLALFSIIFVSYCAAREVTAGFNDDTAWIFSLKYPLGEAPVGENNNLFAFVTGLGGGKNPYAALGFVKGPTKEKEEEITKADGTQVVNRAFDNAASGAFLAWNYVAIGEYCERNGVPGFQPKEYGKTDNTKDDGNDDITLSLGFASQADWAPMQAGSRKDGEDTIYESLLEEKSGLFKLACRAGPKDRTDGGINVKAGNVKCDVHLNLTGRWVDFSTWGIFQQWAETTCPPENRYVALLSYAAAGAFTTKPGQKFKKSDGAEGEIKADDDASGFKWKTEIENKVDGNNYEVVADVDVLAAGLGVDRTGAKAGAVIQVVYSFLSPKSAGDILLWDPEFVIDETAAENRNGASNMVVSMFTVFVALSFFKR